MKQMQKVRPEIITTDSTISSDLSEEFKPECALCRDMGYIVAERIDESGSRYSVAVPCKCLAKRKFRAEVKKSGMGDLFNRYSFDGWEVKSPASASLLQSARRYLADDLPQSWFFVGGQSGAGKTHICASICRALLERGLPVRYMLWRRDSQRLKAIVMEEGYQDEVDAYKQAPVLYIDDFFKAGDKPTAADLNLAFEIIDHRYLSGNAITIISSELHSADLLRLDEAIGGRIIERAGQFSINVPKKPENNYRYRQADDFKTYKRPYKEVDIFDV